MADQKISELANITGANLADADEFVVVDVSADQTKAVTRAEFFKDTPSIDVTGNLTATGDVTIGNDLFLTGPTPVITLTDTDAADEYTKLRNSGGTTYLDSRDGASNGAIIFRGSGGGVDTQYGRFSAGGNFGIGETNPDMKLHIKDATNAYVKLEDSGGVLGGAASVGIRMFTGANEQGQIGFISTALGNMRFNNLQGNVYIGADTNNAHSSSFIRFAVDNTEAARFNQNGDFLVGKTATDVGATAGTEIRNSGLVYISRGGATMVLNRTSGTGALVNISQAGSPVGSITVTASATAYNTSSDYRLKENVTPIQGAADVVMAMQPCTYTAKADGLWYDGFLAHELQEVHPRAVVGTKDAMMDEEYEITPEVYEDVVTPAVEAVAATYDDEGIELTPAVEATPETTESVLVAEAVMGTRSVPDMQSVDYSKLTPILTAALQEALAKIDALETRITSLEG